MRLISRLSKLCFCLCFIACNADISTGGRPYDGPAPTGDGNESAEFNLSSNDFANASALDQDFSFNIGGLCSGSNDFPNLSWSNTPQGTQSFVIIAQDIDASDYIHLSLYDIPAATNSINSQLGDGGTPPQVDLSLYGIEGLNSFGLSGWAGPCPPSGSGPHRYVFKIYALNILQLPAPLNAVNHANFEAAFPSNILDSAELVGTFTSP